MAHDRETAEPMLDAFIASLFAGCVHSIPLRLPRSGMPVFCVQRGHRVSNTEYLTHACLQASRQAPPASAVD